VLVIVTPGGETAKLVNARCWIPSAQGYLVNVARGSVVDELVLLRYLQGEEIAGAGLDVFEHEPAVPVGSRARQCRAVPHVASATVETRKAMGDLQVEPAPALRRQAGDARR
jgi:lactate dehydrogenase-like 2-hydroxyacid dehydrogenase